MVAAARKSIGMAGRPNTITREYAGRHGDVFLNAAWCDMAVTYWARQSGNERAVLLGGDRAYTVWHAEDFEDAGRWHEGTVAEVNAAKPGDVVFFDWGNTNSVGAIDHVGIVEKVLGGGRVQTIEGNTGDAVRRRVRSHLDIAGLGRPAYDAASAPAKPAPARLLRLADPYLRGADVKQVQQRLNAHGAKPKLGEDGVFGPATDKAARSFQKAHRLVADGIVGPKTLAALGKAPA